ncbi:hypothetical protein BpHYR1_006710 [Brachionus plicatilis]|uniref:Uncharacterized protein n=1 Tax=Brachionus plicatilis TaxID=10195 RepID=A0A3M7RRR6_BRAPC|nr:hypothetical protein BpHYR1_006710 [Brachionus plicatilis]
MVDHNQALVNLFSLACDFIVVLYTYFLTLNMVSITRSVIKHAPGSFKNRIINPNHDTKTVTIILFVLFNGFLIQFCNRVCNDPVALRASVFSEI